MREQRIFGEFKGSFFLQEAVKDPSWISGNGAEHTGLGSAGFLLCLGSAASGAPGDCFVTVLSLEKLVMMK